jgi:hypothetical protein
MISGSVSAVWFSRGWLRHCATRGNVAGSISFLIWFWGRGGGGQTQTAWFHKLSLHFFSHTHTQILLSNVVILWDIVLCIPHVNRRFGGTYQVPSHLLHAGFLLGWIPTTKVEETSAHIRATWRCNPKDGNIRNYHCENLKSYTSN